MAAIIGYGVYYGVKKYQKRRDNKKQAAEEQLQRNNSLSVADPSLEILGRQSIPSKRPLAVSSYPSYYTESVYSQPDTLSRDRHNSPTFTQFVDNQMSSHPPSYEESVSSSTPRSPASASHSEDEDDADALSLLPTPLDLYSTSPPAIPSKSPYRSSLATSSIQTQMAELDSTSPVSPTSPILSYRAELADTSPVSPTAPNAAVGTSLRRAPRRSSLMRHEAM